MSDKQIEEEIQESKMPSEPEPEPEMSNAEFQRLVLRNLGNIDARQSQLENTVQEIVRSRQNSRQGTPRSFSPIQVPIAPIAQSAAEASQDARDIPHNNNKLSPLSTGEKTPTVRRLKFTHPRNPPRSKLNKKKADAESIAEELDEDAALSEDEQDAFARKEHLLHTPKPLSQQSLSNKVLGSPASNLAPIAAHEKLVVNNVKPFTFVLLVLKVKPIVTLQKLRFLYKNRNNIFVSLLSCLDETVSNQLHNEYFPIASIEEFMNTPEVLLEECMQKSVMPKSFTEWAEIFESSVSFPDMSGYTYTLNNFKYLYLATLQFTRDVLQITDYLFPARKWEPRLWSSKKAPSGKIQAETLIGRYLAHFPYGTGAKFFEAFMDDDRTAKTLRGFTLMFTTKMREQLDKSEDVHQLSTILFETKKLAPRPTHQQQQASLHMVELLDTSDAQQMACLNAKSNMLSDLSNISPALQNNATVRSVSFNNSKNNSVNKAPTDVIGCPYLMRKQECKYGANCTYSHDPAALARRRDEEVKKMQGYEYSKQSDNRLILSRPADKFSPSFRNNTRPQLSSIIAATADDDSDDYGDVIPTDDDVADPDFDQAMQS